MLKGDYNWDWHKDLFQAGPRHAAIVRSGHVGAHRGPGGPRASRRYALWSPGENSGGLRKSTRMPGATIGRRWGVRPPGGRRAAPRSGGRLDDALGRGAARLGPSTSGKSSPRSITSLESTRANVVHRPLGTSAGPCRRSQADGGADRNRVEAQGSSGADRRSETETRSLRTFLPVRCRVAEHGAHRPSRPHVPNNFQRAAAVMP